jgi:hypothetical protein
MISVIIFMCAIMFLSYCLWHVVSCFQKQHEIQCEFLDLSAHCGDLCGLQLKLMIRVVSGRHKAKISLHLTNYCDNCFKIFSITISLLLRSGITILEKEVALQSPSQDP